MREGRRLVLMSTEQEFTAVEAANFLNVSRPSLPCLRGEGVNKSHGARVRRDPIEAATTARHGSDRPAGEVVRTQPPDFRKKT